MWTLECFIWFWIRLTGPLLHFNTVNHLPVMIQCVRSGIGGWGLISWTVSVRETLVCSPHFCAKPEEEAQTWYYPVYVDNSLQWSKTGSRPPKHAATGWQLPLAQTHKDFISREPITESLPPSCTFPAVLDVIILKEKAVTPRQWLILHQTTVT